MPKCFCCFVVRRKGQLDIKLDAMVYALDNKQDLYIYWLKEILCSYLLNFQVPY